MLRGIKLDGRRDKSIISIVVVQKEDMTGLIAMNDQSSHVLRVSQFISLHFLFIVIFAHNASLVVKETYHLFRVLVNSIIL